MQWFSFDPLDDNFDFGDDGNYYIKYVGRL